MARKSRKNAVLVEIKERIPELQKERRIKVGGYVRLSAERDDSDSIETQMLMIRQFVAGYPELELEDIYCDEGYSGTNFSRPEFTRLIQDIHSGKIECIVVKDFSRFGRNYIEVGYYLETMFPHLGIRFISINDRFDSLREEDRNGLAFPIKNMVNAMYAQDISRKIAKSAELHNRLGDSKYRRTTFGYLLDKEKNLQIVDPVASRYVRLIFDWYLMGYSRNHIAERLDLMEVPIPSVYLESISNRRTKSKSRKWDDTTIGFILKNPAYAGDKVHGRQKTSVIENVHSKRTDPSDWIIHKDNHEPIIDRTKFELVQKKLKMIADQKRKCIAEVAPLGESFKNSFSRKVICRECGTVMQYIRKNQGSNRYGFQTAYYSCSERANAPCRNRIYEDFLKAIVLEQIRNLVDYVAGDQEMVSCLRDGRNDKSALLSNQKRLIYLKKKEAEIDTQLLDLFKNLADGILSEDDFRILNERYRSERKKLSEEIKALNYTVYKMRKWIDTFENLGERLSKYLADSVDSQVLIDELVDCVYASKDGSIEIVFSCEDIIKRFHSLTGEASEEYKQYL